MRKLIAPLAILGLLVAGCSSSSEGEKSTPQDEAALKSGTGAKPPEGFKSPGSAAPAGAPTGN